MIALRKEDCRYEVFANIVSVCKTIIVKQISPNIYAQNNYAQRHRNEVALQK